MAAVATRPACPWLIATDFGSHLILLPAKPLQAYFGNAHLGKCERTTCARHTKNKKGARLMQGALGIGLEFFGYFFGCDPLLGFMFDETPTLPSAEEVPLESGSYDNNPSVAEAATTDPFRCVRTAGT